MLLHNRIYDGLYEVDLTLQTPSTKNKENKLKDKHYPMGTRVDFTHLNCTGMIKS